MLDKAKKQNTTHPPTHHPNHFPPQPKGVTQKTFGFERFLAGPISQGMQRGWEGSFSSWIHGGKAQHFLLFSLGFEGKNLKIFKRGRVAKPACDWATTWVLKKGAPQKWQTARTYANRGVNGTGENEAEGDCQRPSHWEICWHVASVYSMAEPLPCHTKERPMFRLAGSDFHRE